MSTTTDGSQNSQNETYDQALRLNYPDRQEEYFSSQGSFIAPLTQVNQNSAPSSVCYDSVQSISATPTPKMEVAEVAEDGLRKAIAKMNIDMSKHGYKAFVHGNTHFMVKTYPFDL